MELLAGIGQWSGYVLWALLLVVASLFVYLGLGGNFIVLGLALVHALVTGFDPIGWGLLAVLLGIALLGEGIEFVVGTFWVARKGATRHGVIGAFVGGLLGAAAGNGLVPVVGAIAGSFVGAFAGAVAGEYLALARLEPSLRVGGHAFLGRLVAILVKHLLGLVMVGLILRATLP
ncbi:MAG: DUF456 domain-containing protein [Krumholzibacteria bacterium]|nr:DUF456 domain-containing protein [Candidatus Krumholzibacteria bacterium]